MVLLRAVQTINSPDLIFGMTQGGPAGSSHIASSYIMTEVVKGNDYGLVSAAGVIFMAGNACLYGSLYRMHQHPERK